MKKTILIFSAAAMLGANCASAQSGMAAAASTSTSETEKPDHAKLRAAAYAAALDLDEKTTLGLVKVFTMGTDQLMPLYEQRNELDEKIEATWAPLDAKAEGMLSAEQVAKLKELKKAGTFKASACAESKAGCGKEGAAAGGCCAGKAGAKADVKGGSKADAKPSEQRAKGTAEPVKPNATMH